MHEKACSLAFDVGGVLATWIALVALENVVVAFLFDEQFVGSWETAHARHYAAPIAFALLLPVAVLAVAVARLMAARRTRLLGTTSALLGAWLAVGVSGGRHMESLFLRAPFVAVVSAISAGLAVVATRAARSWVRTPVRLAAVGAVTASLAWAADATVLPRLYPAFHAALLVLALAGWSSLSLILRPVRAARAVAVLGLLIAAFSALWAPHAARALAFDDNLRRVLLEHAPLLGRAVLAASYLAPPLPLDDEESRGDNRATEASARPTPAARTLDWTGHDIVLITVDALRADHVSSYGYKRATTPNIDRLAGLGTRFEHAYCPTPHTSYSVASMMTGKYMRPLLRMGATDAAETWADNLRRYDYKTAAFYPPAVFFIDEHRFRHMQANGLGFEYRKEEFASPELRAAQVAEYVANAPVDKPLFLWVHLFEPHEPYEKHPAHDFGGDESIDAYDSEIATADDVIGEIAAAVEKRQPGAVFLLSADHGEEFGDHGGRYHGTTVYEEQVRVPLIIVGPGVPSGVVDVPVQTIDLLPTTLKALAIPQSARVRGRDLGSLITRNVESSEQGLAFAESDDYTLVARGADRLVCVRKIGSCTLFDVSRDPHEARPILDKPARVQELRRLTAGVERENGTLEAREWPEALRRGSQGDIEAAEGVAALLDDARVDIRREAARCAFRLRANAIVAQLKRARDRDEDQDVKRWSGLALLRLGLSEHALDAADLLRNDNVTFRRAAALALAERGDARGEGELVARWEAAFLPGARDPGELDEARELLDAFAKIRAKTAAPALIKALDDVRLRTLVAVALAEIGDARASAPLLFTLAQERRFDARIQEARALSRLGVRESLLPSLRHFAGVPEPMLEGVALAYDLGLLVPARGGWSVRADAAEEKGAGSAAVAGHTVEVNIEGTGPARLLALARTTEMLREAGASDPALSVPFLVDGRLVNAVRRGDVWLAEVSEVGPRARVELVGDAILKFKALWIVRRANETSLSAADGGPPVRP